MNTELDSEARACVALNMLQAILRPLINGEDEVTLRRADLPDTLDLIERLSALERRAMARNCEPVT